MELKIIHFYPDLMSLYGSYANVAVLKRYLEQMGNTVTVETIQPGASEAGLVDPDFIFISTMGKESAAKAHMETVLAEPAWQSLSAVKNGRVIYLPKELFQFKPNARWGDAYAYLIEVLYAA